MSWPIKLELNPINGLSANVWKLFNESEARIWQEFSGMWPKVYLADKDHNELAHQILAKSDPRFFCKWVETTGSIRGQEMEEIQWSSAAHNDLAQQIWAQSDQWFICKLAETIRAIRRQQMEIQWSKTTI